MTILALSDSETTQIALAAISAISGGIVAGVPTILAYLFERGKAKKLGAIVRELEAISDKLHKLLNEQLKKCSTRPPPTPPEIEGPVTKNGLVKETITAPMGRAVLCLSDKSIVPTPRYVHFAWGNAQGNPMVFRLRDFIGGERQYQPGGPRPARERGFTDKECQMPRDQVWAAAKERIPAVGELDHRVDDFPFWLDKLFNMTKNGGCG